MKKGDKVKLPSGRHGVIHSTHSGTYYGVHVGGLFGFYPASHVEPDTENGTPSNPDPDHDGDNDTPSPTP